MTDNDYVELNVIIPAVSEDKREIAIALLSESGFESFVDTPSGINAYIRSDQFSITMVEESGLLNVDLLKDLSYSSRSIQRVNWNEQWEKNFPPMMIAGRCSVRAPFHPEKPEAEYDIIIEPKMSFGTGHHHTTSLMIEMMLNMHFTDMKVLDMGCGTGILAILAAKRGAGDITAVDIDEWAWKNTMENAAVNKADIKAFMGDTDIVSDQKFNIILANITRNILRENMELFCRILLPEGTLLLSGYLNDDLNDMISVAEKCGLHHEKSLVKEGWCASMFKNN